MLLVADAAEAVAWSTALSAIFVLAINSWFKYLNDKRLDQLDRDRKQEAKEAKERDELAAKKIEETATSLAIKTDRDAKKNNQQNEELLKVTSEIHQTTNGPFTALTAEVMYIKKDLTSIKESIAKLEAKL